MSKPEPVPDEMKEADRLAREAVAKISEHVDAVTVFICKRREDGRQGTWRGVFGAGNWYARYGHIRHWLVVEDAVAAEEPFRKPDSDDA